MPLTILEEPMPKFSVKISMHVEGVCDVEAPSEAAVKAIWPFDMIRESGGEAEWFRKAELIDYGVSSITQLSKD